jgi:hypothetical protein
MADEELNQKLDRQKMWIENIKWFIASVLIVVVALIVDSNFKKRDLMLRELDQYDKFVDLLIANNNTIGAQYKVAGFYDKFSISKDIKEKWDIYLQELKKEYDEYNEYLASTNSVLQNLESKPIKSNTDLIQIDSLKEKKNVLQKVLSPEIKVPSKTTDVSVENNSSKFTKEDLQVLKEINDAKLKKNDLKVNKQEKPDIKDVPKKK